MNADRAAVFILWLIVLGMAASAVAGTIWWGLGDKSLRLVLVVLMPVTALTAVLHLRLYAVRVCSVVRATAGIERVDSRIRAVP